MSETAVIHLGNKSFRLFVSETDKERRILYSKEKPGGELTGNEREILNSLGVDDVLEKSLRPYLAEFFNTLQHCNTDSKLILNKECETAHYVVWSTLFNMKQDTQKRINENKAKYPGGTDLNVAMIGTLTDEFRANSSASFINQLFTLKFKTLPEDDSKFIQNLFTLKPMRPASAAR
jgi:hypothetical protein